MASQGTTGAEASEGVLPKNVEDALTSKTMESFEKALENHIEDSATEYSYYQYSQGGY